LSRVRKVIYAEVRRLFVRITNKRPFLIRMDARIKGDISLKNQINRYNIRLNFVYILPPVPPNPKKIQALRSAGALNRYPQKVHDPLFRACYELT